MSRILLGVSGGIAAYKELELVRLATAAGHAVRVVQWPVRERCVGQDSFAALIGRSGGIAAYKSLELVRLATSAGHAVRVVQTPVSKRFVGPASFAALSGAPVLVSEFERDPMRGAFPGQALPEHEPLSHLELV